MSYDDWEQNRAEHLEPILQSGEDILWQGKPVRGHFVRHGALSYRTLFGVVFLSFALFWTGMAFQMTWMAPKLQEGRDAVPLVFKYVFPLWGLPFIVAGACLVFGPFISKVMSWKNTEYALTNQRVLIRGGAGTPTINSTELHDVTGVTVTGEAVGSVSFTIGEGASPTFECIAHPQDVHRIAADALHGLRRDSKY